MAVQSQAWVGFAPCAPRFFQPYRVTVDLGGSLAVASKGLFATGVSTDLNGKQGNSAT
jgi:hypothetical protein